MTTFLSDSLRKCTHLQGPWTKIDSERRVFDDGGETPGQLEQKKLTDQEKALTEANTSQQEQIRAQFTKLNTLLTAQLSDDDKDPATSGEWTKEEQATYHRFKAELLAPWRAQIDERLATMDAHAESGDYELKALEGENVKGRWLNDIAKEYGMSIQDLITLNKSEAQTKKTPFHSVKHANGKYYCWATDTVYVKVKKDVTTPAETTAPRPVVKIDEEKDANLREYRGITALEEQREEAAEITSTREALLSTDRRGGTRKEALAGTRLHKKDSIPVDESIKQALDVKDWEKFKEAWKEVQGAGHIEDLFNNRLTFKAQGFHLRGYMEVLKKLQWSGADTTGKGAELQFKDVLNTVFPKGTAAETLILSIAQAQGNTIDTNSKFLKKLFHGLITDVNGNFLNSYDRMLDEVKFTQSKPTYLGDGNAKVTLTMGDQTLTLTAPVEQLVVLPDEIEPDVEENVAEMQKVIDECTPIAVFFSPEGQIRSGIGVIFEASQIEGDVSTAVAGKGQALALLQAMETIYKDTAELYEMTGELIYKESGADTSGTELRADVEATGAEGTSFAATLESAFDTRQFERRTREAKGLRTKKNQISYEDVESGVSYTMAKEELFKYFSGEGAMQEILDRFAHESFNAAGEKVTSFDAEGAQKYMENIFRAALLKNPELLEKKFGNDIETAVTTFKENFANNTLTKDEIQMVQEGFLMSMVQLHGFEVREGRDAANEGRETREAITVMFSDEFIASVFDAYEAQTQMPLSMADRQRISNALSVGFHLGFLRTIDEGVTKTTVHEIYDADGQLVERGEPVTEVKRKAGTLDSFKLDTVALGLAPINISGLGPNGRGHFSLGFGGQIGLNEHAGEWGGGLGGRYQLDLTDSGLALYTDAGLGAGFDENGFIGVGPTVGGGIKIPVSVLMLDLHGHAYVGGFEVGATLGADTEKIYALRLEHKLKKTGFATIDQMLTEGKPSKEVAEAILTNPEFAPLKLSEVAQTLNTALGLEAGTDIANDPQFHQFVIDIYRGRRSEFAAEVLHGTSANPLYSLSVGLGVKVDAGVTSPQAQLGITVYSRPLTYRTPTGVPYGNLSDARIAEKLRTGRMVNVTEMVLRGEVPQMQLDREGEPAFITEGDSIEGILVGEKQLAEFNSHLHESGLHLSPRQISRAGADERASTDTRTLLELQVADVDGNLDIVIDPSLKGKVTLTYLNGSGNEPDHYFLAFAPGTNLTLKRQDFHYPYKKNGAYENTVITITENPLVSRGQLTELERAPSLRHIKGQRTVADYTHSGDIGTEGNLLPIETYFDQTADTPANERADWSRISEQDQVAREFMQEVGTINYGEVLDPTVQTKLTEEAKRLMDPTQKDEAVVAFRKEFKEISLAGKRYNPEKLRTLCAEKGKAVLGLDRELTDGELDHFIQALTIYSFIDLHGSGDVAALQHQKEAYEKMLHGFMRDSLIREFDKQYSNSRAIQMADYVVAKLEITDPNHFKTENGHKLPEGGVFGSIAGSERIVGIRINEGYRDQDLYAILKLTSFDLHSTNPVERDVAKAIIGILNPLPKAVEVTEANAKALQTFLRDDFTLRMALMWSYKDAGEHKALKDLITAAQNDNPQHLMAAIDTAGSIDNKILLKTFQAFTVNARAAELAETSQRVKLADDLYISFADVQTSFFVFQRCGNVSLYLQEKIVLENRVGQVITVMDESHRMVKPHGAEARLWVGAGAGVTTQRMGGHGEETTREDLEDPEANQGGDGTEDEGYDEDTDTGDEGDTGNEGEETWNDDD